MPTERGPFTFKAIFIWLLRILEWGLYGFGGLLALSGTSKCIWLMFHEPYGVKSLIGFAQEIKGLEPIGTAEIVFTYLLIPMVSSIPVLLGRVVNFIIVRWEKVMAANGMV